MTLLQKILHFKKSLKSSFLATVKMSCNIQGRITPRSIFGTYWAMSLPTPHNIARIESMTSRVSFSDMV